MHSSSPPHSPTPWSAASGRFFWLAIALLIAYLAVGGRDFAFFYDAHRQFCSRQPTKPACLGLLPPQSDAPAPSVPKAPVDPASSVEVEQPPAVPNVGGARGVIRVVTSYRLNVRPQPGADDVNQPIVILKRDDQVRLVGEQQTIDGGVWVLIEVDGVQGWVNSRFLDEP